MESSSLPICIQYLGGKKVYVLKAELLLKGAEGAGISNPRIWGFKKGTEREIDSILLSPLRFENLTTALLSK